VAEELSEKGYGVEIPFTSQRIINGELTLEEFLNEKQKNGDGALRKIQGDLIKCYYEIIKNSDAVLVINMNKNGIENYIDGNTLIEMAFAHMLDRKIFLLNSVFCDTFFNFGQFNIPEQSVNNYFSPFL